MDGSTRESKAFRETAGVTGLVMTKLDGTARGGVLVAAAERYGLPSHAVGVGETMTNLRPFDADELARAIAGARCRGPRMTDAAQPTERPETSSGGKGWVRTCRSRCAR